LAGFGLSGLKSGIFAQNQTNMGAIITSLKQLKANRRYSYADYLQWQFEERVELLRGKVYHMFPAPSVRHQRLVSFVHGELYGYFRKRPCQLFVAPFDVRLYNRKKSLLASEEIFSVVQPDVCVVCDSSKLDKQGCNGAPDLVIEVLSPGNSKREMQDKFELYEEAGVQEYWLVEPSDNFIIVYTLNEAGKYIGLQPMTLKMASPLFPELKLNLTKLFA
jgi:Uma2 family endonuclease